MHVKVIAKVGAFLKQRCVVTPYRRVLLQKAPVKVKINTVLWTWT